MLSKNKDATLPGSVDVFIAGGGPAGLATAIAARHHALSVLVADGAAAPIDKPCGEGLMPDSVEALHKLGVTIPEGEAFPFRGIRFLSDERSAEGNFPFGTAYGIRRTTLHRILMQHAADCGVALRFQAVVTGLHPEGALIGGKLVRARWIVGADSSASRVRSWANLDDHHHLSQRFAFRRHYRVAPWTNFMELYFGRECQVYVTPVGPQEVCVAVMSRSPKLRLEDALLEFSTLASRLHPAIEGDNERGAITVSRKLRNVYRDHIALVGDASGGVDAITGEGLCLTFRQAALLADCLATGDLHPYQAGHRKIAQRPTFMAEMILLMARKTTLRARAMRAFQSSPGLFAKMLAMHVGAATPCEYAFGGLALGWNFLKA